MIVQIIATGAKCITMILICIYSLNWVKDNILANRKTDKDEIISKVNDNKTAMNNEIMLLHKRLDRIDCKQDETLNLLKNILEIGRNYDFKKMSN